MGYFGDSRARQERIERDGNFQVSTRSWQEAVDKMMAEDDASNVSAFDGYMGVVKDANKNIALYNQRKQVAGAAMLQSAYDNGGMSDRALSDSLSEALGQPVYGCQILRGLKGEEAELNGQAAVYGLTKDQNGNATVGIVGLIDQKSQLGMLQGAKTGDRTLKLQQFLYDGLSKRYTPEQMQGMGFRNPSGVQVVGGTTDGNATSRLFGITSKPKPRSGISAFGADGKGGTTNYDSNVDTNHQLVSVDGGTRGENYKGRWKLRTTGPSDTFGKKSADGTTDRTQMRVYENDKTGEVVRVKDGETPPWERRAANGKNATNAAGGGDSGNWHENVANINAASREKIAGMDNATKKDIATGHDRTQERINEVREKGRQARAVLRDDQAWGKLAVEQQKVDNNFAVQMKKADTYGKRVDLIEKKIKNDYDVAMKRATTEAERQKVEATYKERMADIADGNLDLNWLKADNAQTNAEVQQDQAQQRIDNDKEWKAERTKMMKEISMIKALASRGGVGKRAGAPDEAMLKRCQEMQKTLNGSNISAENRKLLRNQLNGMLSQYGQGGDKATIKSGDNSGDENIPGYAPDQIAELKKRGYRWDGKDWVKKGDR